MSAAVQRDQCADASAGRPWQSAHQDGGIQAPPRQAPIHKPGQREVSMTQYKSTWTLADIEQMKGQEESIRLEFKAGSLLDKPQSTWVSDLSREVSAFANTEGGEIILGMSEEKRGKNRVAGDPDGVPGSLTRDQLQRLIEGNVYPYLTGIRVHRIPLSSQPDRAVFVVAVPQGTTAYQANDGRYYGRSELEAKYLPDHEIRLRMARGKVAKASVSFRFVKVTIGESGESQLRNRHAATLEEFKTDFEGAVRNHPDVFLEILATRHEPIFDTIDVDFLVRNDGEMTIRDPAIEFSETSSEQPTRVTRYESPGVVIYPGDARLIPDSGRRFSCKRDAIISPGDHVIKWKVFLDNAPPSHGEFDLAVSLQERREEAYRCVAESGT